MRIPWNMLLRDLLVAAIALTTPLASHGLEGSGSAMHGPLSVFAAVLLALTGYLLHERGHLPCALTTAALEMPPAWRVLRSAALPQQGPAFERTARSPSH